MNRVAHCLLLLVLLAAVPVSGAQRTRAAGTIPETPYTGRVVDETTRRAVVAAEISSGNRTARTDAGGFFTIDLPLNRPTSLTIRRSGYEQVTVTVTAVAQNVIISPSVPPASVEVPLKPRPPVIVTMTGGQRRVLDADTIEFAYVIPFASPVAANTVSVCGNDGVPFVAKRTDFRRIIGPATLVSGSRCCAAPALRVRAEMTSGASLDLFFADSCSGYDMNLLGRDRETAEYVYLKLTEIAEIAFPA